MARTSTGRWVSLICVFLASPLIQGAAAAPAPSQDVAHPTFVLRPDKGFIDDPFAIDAATKRLAVLRTDSASFARIEIVDLVARKTIQIIALGDPHPVFEKIWFAGDGGLIVVIRDANDGRRSAQYYDPAGKPLGLAGPVTDFGWTVRSGQAALIGWDKKAAANGDNTFTMSQFRPAGLSRVGKPRTFAVAKNGELRKPPLRVIAWQDGYSQVVGQRPGAYDAKKDFRQPDQAACFDVLKGDFAWSAEIGDVYGWALVSDLRRRHPNRSIFSVLAEDGGAFDFVDAQGRKTPIQLPVDLKMYDARSLQEQEDAASGSLYFSLALDPLNPAALGRQKADKPYLDVYLSRMQEAAVKHGAGLVTTPVVRTALDDRPVAWAASPSFLVLLRKFKSFARGGNEIEIYELK